MDGQDLATSAADTNDPRRGLRAVSALRRLADELELRQVEAALAQGMGWPEIADALGGLVHIGFAVGDLVGAGGDVLEVAGGVFDALP